MRHWLAYMERDMKKAQQGFTLIELMIVVAIIGIIAMLAVPAYQTYLIRAQVAEGLTLSAPLKAGIAEYYEVTGNFPSNNTEAGLATPGSYSGKYVTSLSVDDDEVSIQYGNAANGEISGLTVTITAVPNQGSLTWVCASGGVIPNNYLPSACR